MKTVSKVLIGAAVMAASAGAAQAAATLPSTDSSQLLFFVNDLSTHSTYTAVLTQTVGTSGYFTSGDANAAGATVGVINTTTGDPNFSYDFTADSALQSFITSAQGAGNTLDWGILGGAYSGITQLNREPTGNTLFVTSGAGSPLNHVPESAMTATSPVTLNTDVGKLNAQTFDAYNGTTSGIFGTSLSANGTNLSTEGIGYTESGTAIGTTAYNLYGFSSTGSAGGQGLIFQLGTATFNGDVLSFTGNPASAVPLPAAAWLFGSGLLGLLGIGRRRESANASPSEAQSQYI